MSRPRERSHLKGMEAIGLFYVTLAIATVAALLVGVGGIAWSSRDRWFGPAGTAVVGGGAFRTAPISTAPRRQARRWVVLAVAVLSVLWAALTLFAFIPAGALAGLLGLIGSGEGDADSGLWIGLGLAALAGLPVVLSLVLNALLAVRRDERAPRLGYATATLVALHHAMLVIVGLCTLGGSLEEIGTFTAIAASPGLALASLIALGAHLAGREG